MPVLLCMLMAIPMITTQGAKSWPCVCLQVSLLVVHPPCTQPFNIERSCLSIQPKQTKLPHLRTHVYYLELA